MKRCSSPKCAQVTLSKKQSLIDTLRMEITKLSNIDTKMLTLNNEIMEVESKCLKTINETEKAQNEFDMKKELWMRESEGVERDRKEVERRVNQGIVEMQKETEMLGRIKRELVASTAEKEERANQGKREDTVKNSTINKGLSEKLKQTKSIKGKIQQQCDTLAAKLDQMVENSKMLEKQYQKLEASNSQSITTISQKQDTLKKASEKLASLEHQLTTTKQTYKKLRADAIQQAAVIKELRKSSSQPILEAIRDQSKELHVNNCKLMGDLKYVQSQNKEICELIIEQQQKSNKLEQKQIQLTSKNMLLNEQLVRLKKRQSQIAKINQNLRSSITRSKQYDRKLRQIINQRNQLNIQIY